MARNIELKARCPDPASAHRVAGDLDAPLHAVERQRDTYFAAATGRLKLRQIWSGAPESSTAEPDRRADRCELIGYSRPDASEPRPSDYELVTVDDGDRLGALLSDAIGVTVEVVKHRTVYLHDNVRIHVDEVAGLGSFVEFEAIVDETCDATAARAKVDRLRDAFGIRDEETIAVSYSDLLLRSDRTGEPGGVGRS